jgi:hypothetical protein
LIILGAVISNGKQEVISMNTSTQRVDMMSESFKENEDIQIYRGDTIQMGPYFVHYKGEYIENGYFYNYQFEYFDQKSRNYFKGDSIRYKDMAFVATQSHTASQEFIEDMNNNWSPIQFEDNSDFLRLNRWHHLQANNFCLKSIREYCWTPKHLEKTSQNQELDTS